MEKLNTFLKITIIVLVITVLIPAVYKYKPYQYPCGVPYKLYGKMDNLEVTLKRKAIEVEQYRKQLDYLEMSQESLKTQIAVLKAENISLDNELYFRKKSTEPTFNQRLYNSNQRVVSPIKKKMKPKPIASKIKKKEHEYKKEFKRIPFLGWVAFEKFF